MTADEMINAYVRDVAACLPRKSRQDTALELRALLGEELRARAESLGRAPDRDMVLTLLKAHGRPAEAARRYHERPSLIDPADTHHFLIWSLGGTVALSILMGLDRRAEMDSGLFLQWIGLLAIIFTLSAWWRRRRPEALNWKPRADPDQVPRSLSLLAFAATLFFPVFMYAAPETFTRTVFLGLTPLEGLALTDAFLQSSLRMITLLLLTLSALLYGLVAIQGRRTNWTRRSELVLAGLLGLLFAAHPSARVFESDLANTISTPIFGLIAALYLLSLLYEAWREWTRVSLEPKGLARPLAREQGQPT